MFDGFSSSSLTIEISTVDPTVNYVHITASSVNVVRSKSITVTGTAVDNAGNFIPLSHDNQVH